MDRDVEYSVMPNGVRLVTRRMPGVRTVALGVWLHNGSRHESDSQHGYAHLLEHLLFKGSATYPQFKLAQHFEAMGGQINAHTGRELSALHGLVPAADAPVLLTLFASMLCDPGFTQEDLQRERGVVLQEIAGLEDVPEEHLEEEGIARAWPDHPMGRPILGRHGSVANAEAATLRDYLRERLVGQRLWIVAVGDVDHAALLHRGEALLALPTGETPQVTPPGFQGGRSEQHEDLHQSHLLWLSPAVAIDDPHYAARLMANHLFAGGVSSRLFQELREQFGLVYALHARLESFSDAGLWLVQTACQPERADDCREIVERHWAQLAAGGPTPDEFAIARAHLRANLRLEEDNPEAAMERLAREVIYLGRHRELGELEAALDAVSPASIRSLCAAAHSEPMFIHWHP